MKVGGRQKLALSKRLRLSEPAAALPSLEPPADKPLPLHARIRQQITQRILSGEWPVGTVLPNENALAETMGVSVGTLRRALSDLANGGLLTRHPKIGTTVTGQAPPLGLKDSFHYFRLHGPGDTLAGAESTVFGYEQRPATPQEADVLSLPTGALVHRFERVRRLGGVPMMWEYAVFSRDLAPDIASMADIPATLLLHFLESYGVRITSLRERLSAALADDDDRRILERAGDFAVLVIEEIAFDQLGRPIVWAFHRAITDDFKYINVVS